MTIHCKICNWPIKSLQADLSAQGQVMQSMAQHLAKCHPTETTSLAADVFTLQMALSTYLMLRHYVRIPAEETALLQSYQQAEQSLINLLSPAPVD